MIEPKLFYQLSMNTISPKPETRTRAQSRSNVQLDKRGESIDESIIRGKEGLNSGQFLDMFTNVKCKTVFSSWMKKCHHKGIECIYGEANSHICNSTFSVRPEITFVPSKICQNRLKCFAISLAFGNMHVLQIYTAVNVCALWSLWLQV